MYKTILLVAFVLSVLLAPSLLVADTTSVTVTISVLECNDSLDNDSDGLIDYPDDPGCDSLNDDDETDPILPQCGNGIDDDSDGNIDFPDDLGCDSDSDNDESSDSSSGSSGGGGGGGSGGGSSGSSSINLSGRAFPLSNVIVLKDGKEIISTIAGPDAKFDVNVSSLRSGSYTFSVVGEDRETGERTSLFNFPVSLTDSASTDIGSIFVAPTLSSDKIEVKRGNTVSFFGQTAPNSSVTIQVNSETELFLNTVADDDGVYLYNLDSIALEPGEHSAKSKSTYINEISPFGQSVAFQVGTKDVLRTSGSTDNSNEVILGDLNGDSKVNILDFSIAAFWYKKSLTSEMSALESIYLNGDGVIDIFDFSMMSFHWTG